MDKNILQLSASLHQPCTMLLFADTDYVERKIVEACFEWNTKQNVPDKLDLYYYNTIKGLMNFNSISPKTGEFIFTYITEANGNEAFAGPQQKTAIKLVPKLVTALLNICKEGTEKDKITHRAVVVLDSILEYPNKEIWYAIKKSIDYNYPISWVIVANNKVGIPHYMDRYISYPEITEIIDINNDLYNERISLLDTSYLHKFKIDPKLFDWSLKDRIHPMTISEFKSLESYLQSIAMTELEKEEASYLLERATKFAWKELAKSSNLDLIIDNKTTFNDIGGLNILKNNMQIAASIFKNRDKALALNVPIPKAIILQGPQGTGKTESSKAIANEFGAKFVILNIANLFSGRVGDTEANFQMAINNLKTLAPVVVLIDEADKVLTGTQSSGQSDAGTTSRAMQTLTGFMAEPHPGIFLILTANDPDKIELEFLRKGRTDDIYFVDVPSIKSRKEIIAVHLRRVGTPETEISKFIKSKEILKATEQFTGAEIAESIYSAKRKSFFEDPELALIKKEALLESFSKTIPLAISEKEKFTKLREWGHKHAILAEDKEEDTESLYML